MVQKNKIDEGILKSFFGLLAAGVLGYMLGKKSHVEIESEDPEKVRAIEQLLKKNKSKIMKGSSEQISALADAVAAGKINDEKDFNKYARFLGYDF